MRRERSFGCRRYENGRLDSLAVHDIGDVMVRVSRFTIQNCPSGGGAVAEVQQTAGPFAPHRMTAVRAAQPDSSSQT